MSSSDESSFLVNSCKIFQLIHSVLMRKRIGKKNLSFGVEGVPLDRIEWSGEKDD